MLAKGRTRTVPDRSGCGTSRVEEAPACDNLCKRLGAKQQARYSSWAVWAAIVSRKGLMDNRLSCNSCSLCQASPRFMSLPVSYSSRFIRACAETEPGQTGRRSCGGTDPQVQWPIALGAKLDAHLEHVTFVRTHVDDTSTKKHSLVADQALLIKTPAAELPTGRRSLGNEL